MARKLHEGISGSVLAVLPGARHLAPVEKAREVVAVLSKVLPQHR
jgi:pimeloyl-ACP methyl ester carboxylesterase